VGYTSVPSMALILLVKVQSRVFTAKCSEPQVDTGNGMDEGSCKSRGCGTKDRIKDGTGLLNPLSYRRETCGKSDLLFLILSVTM